MPYVPLVFIPVGVDEFGLYNHGGVAVLEGPGGAGAVLLNLPEMQC